MADGVRRQDLNDTQARLAPDGGRQAVWDFDVARGRLASPDLNPRSAFARCVTEGGTSTISARNRGRAPDVAERAFEPFFITEPSGQGTGLGLSVISGFVSRPGTGATVEINLPRLRGADETQSEAEPMDEDANRAEDGEVVVVVEDDAIVRMMIVDVLAEIGYTALEASDGPEGIAILAAAPRVDLLITDIGLPGMNGRQLANAARTERPDLKILFMTGYAESAAGPEGFLGHGMEMVTKPVTMEVLAARIRAMIG